MEIVIFSFTNQASKLSTTLNDKLKQEAIPFIANLNRKNTTENIACNITSYTPKQYVINNTLTELPNSIQNTVKQYFKPENVIIFISACGIAVRCIAPFVKNKTTDPCVIVIDELGQFVISLLSGHIGCGNDFTKKIAQLINATPIISTATDLNNKFSVDVFARKNNLFINNMNTTKLISASILNDIQVGIFADYNIEVNGNIPNELTFINNQNKYQTQSTNNTLASSNTINTPTIKSLEYGFTISAFTNRNIFTHTLNLIPRQVVIGIGCKRNTSPQLLSDFVKNTLDKYNISPRAIVAITSIDIKKNETAIIELSKEYNCPFVTYSADTLRNVSGQFSHSDFVANVTGVDNVCERATMCYSKVEELFLPKTKGNGVTIALSFLKMNFCF